jgi:hypothetical protein
VERQRLYLIDCDQAQVATARLLLERLDRTRSHLGALQAAQDACSAADVTINDLTLHTCDDLAFEANLVTGAITKRITLLLAQVCRPQR